MCSVCSERYWLRLFASFFWPAFSQSTDRRLVHGIAASCTLPSSPDNIVNYSVDYTTQSGRLTQWVEGQDYVYIKNSKTFYHPKTQRMKFTRTSPQVIVLDAFMFTSLQGTDYCTGGFKANLVESNPIAIGWMNDTTSYTYSISSVFATWNPNEGSLFGYHRTVSDVYFGEHADTSDFYSEFVISHPPT